MIYISTLLTLPFFIHILHFATQKGQIFGFWQRVLDYLYGNERLRFLEKPLGGCYLCFSNLVSALVIVLLWIFVGRPFEAIIGSLFVSSFLVSTITVLSVLLHGHINKEKQQ